MSAAVVLMAYGSPERLADVPAYYADIRGGRPISPENLDDLVARYRALGVEEHNPLNAITEETRAALEQEVGLPVFTGMKHWTPRIADAAEAALATGAEVVVGLVLAPHYSRLSIAGYRSQLEEALGGRADLRFVESWHLFEPFLDVLAARLDRLDRAETPTSQGQSLGRGRDAQVSGTVPGPRPERAGPGTHVVFTAHSLPARILEEGDPYERQLQETCAAVAERARLTDWSFAYQSESPTGEPWLGPDILDHLGTLNERGVDDVLVCPVGFVSDHLEIRWDIDVEAQDRARELGMRLQRIEMPNAAPDFVRALASLVEQEVGARAPR